MLKHVVLFLTIVAHVDSFLPKKIHVLQTGVKLKLSSTPFDIFAAGLQSLKQVKESTKHATHTIPTQHKIPTSHQDTSPPISHESKIRPESTASLTFDPVRIFGKGHPGTGNTRLNPMLLFSPHISFAVTWMPIERISWRKQAR